jgi:putative transposase
VYECIESKMSEFPKTEVLRLLKADKSSFYRWQGQTVKVEHRMGMEEKIGEVFWRHSRRYGSRRIQAELIAEGFSIGRQKIRRVMRSQGLKAIQPRSFVPRTTNSRHSLGYSPNLLLEMKLPPQGPLEVIVGDITYVPLQGGGWCYLASWTDLFSRRILGWAIREDMTENLVIEAFLMLLRRVRLPLGCIIHSDRGGQYASKNFRALLKLHKCRQSMSRAGETYDNAFAESLFSRFKAELLEGGSFANVEEARMETAHYIDGYYNPVRRHSGIGYLSPLEFEAAARQKAENRAVFSFLKPNSIDNKPKGGINLKQYPCPTF